jgi:hypothetical protein
MVTQGISGGENERVGWRVRSVGEAAGPHQASRLAGKVIGWAASGNMADGGENERVGWPPPGESTRRQGDWLGR